MHWNPKCLNTRAGLPRTSPSVSAGLLIWAVSLDSGPWTSFVEGKPDLCFHVAIYTVMETSQRPGPRPAANSHSSSVKLWNVLCRWALLEGKMVLASPSAPTVLSESRPSTQVRNPHFQLAVLKWATLCIDWVATDSHLSVVSYSNQIKSNSTLSWTKVLLCPKTDNKVVIK